jgi:hypothetical protein
MPFLLDGNPSQSEVSDAVNYLLSNFTTGLASDVSNGQITGSGGIVVGYLYQYLSVKYSDSFDGSLNFNDLPTNRQYYGLRNSSSSVESANPSDYIWTKATGGFGVSKYLWYQTTGGRAIQLAVATAAPDVGWFQEPGYAIDLDVVTSATIPVIVESFVSYFTPGNMQVPRTGSTLTPVFTNITPVLFATDKGTVVPYSGATTDSNVAFVNNSWRIGNSSTTGFGDISYSNITIGDPTDAGDYAIWPEPTAMANSPAYITVPIRYKNSLGEVSQASVAKLQLLFADPGATGQQGVGIDISGYTAFVQNAGGAYTPTTATLVALLTNVTLPTYSWAISGATPTTATTASVVITPTSSSTGVTVTLTVNGTNLLSPISKTVKLPVVYDGAAGTAGANGMMSAFPSIYIWTGSSTPPARPTTTSTYTWATNSYTAPSGWSTTAPSNTTAGNYLWQITIPLSAVATTTTSPLNWTDTAYTIRAIAYNGANGVNGINGINGTNGAPGSATFVITRAANDSSAPTNLEVSTLIGRNPVAGDICTVSYNSANNAVVYRYVTSWVLFTTYITGSLIVSNTITGDKVAANTITGTNIAASTITADKLSASYIQVGNAASDVNSGVTTINGGKITANSITVNEINNVATGQIIAGSFNFQPFTTTGTTTWSVPAYVYKLKVTVVGGGGGGGTSGSTIGGGGGGGGGAIKIIPVNPADVCTITVGNGGAAGSAGSLSRFVVGSYTITCNGGNPGSGGAAGIGGTATGGDLNISGASGQGQSADGGGGSAPFIGVGTGYGQAGSTNSGSGGNGSSGLWTAKSGGSGVIIVEY